MRKQRLGGGFLPEKQGAVACARRRNGRQGREGAGSCDWRMEPARLGADTLLVERYGFLGGMATAGLVNSFMTYFAGDEQIIEGVFQELLDRLSAKGG